MALFLGFIICSHLFKPSLILSRVQKFSYLKAQLQGDVARTTVGLPLTELNYQHSMAS